MKNPWEQQKNEINAAYVAFRVYRDMGPRRSVEKAYQTSQSDRRGRRAPGSWNKWFRRFKWMQRAAAWDSHNERVWQEAHDVAIAETARQRADFEIATQPLIEEQVTNIRSVLQRAVEAPIVETVTNEESRTPAVEGEPDSKPTIVLTLTKKKGISLTGLARLIEQLIRTRREAVLGPNPELRPAKESQADKADVQTRLITAHKRLLAVRAAKSKATKAPAKRTAVK